MSKGKTYVSVGYHGEKGITVVVSDGQKTAARIMDPKAAREFATEIIAIANDIQNKGADFPAENGVFRSRFRRRQS